MLAIFFFFDLGHPSGYKVVAHCGLICIFLMTNDVEHLFMCLLAVYLLWKNVYSDPLPILKYGCLLLIELNSSLYILGTRTFSNIWFANIFSHSVGCLFTFLMVSVEAQKFKILMMSSIFFSFVACAFGVMSKKPLTNSRLCFTHVFF